MGAYKNGTFDKSGGIIIAPSNSVQKSKADYVLSGTNDAATINQIINFLTNGGKLLFLDGDINISGLETISIKNNITIEGCGNSTVFNLTNNAIGFSQTSGTGTLYYPRLKNFLIQGDSATVPATTTVGLQLTPQEAIIEGVKATGCKIGIDLDGGYSGATSLMNLVNNCYLVLNTSKGLKIGMDSNVSKCIIGDNGNPETLHGGQDYDACGINITGWGCNIQNNHIYKNNFGIRSDWTVGNIIVGNEFESGYQEDILFAGRAHANKVSANSFMGKDKNATEDWSSYNCISFIGAPDGEGSQKNVISGNSLIYYVTEATTKTPYNYFVQEVVNCDYNNISYNVLNGYFKQATSVLKVGANTIVEGNL